METILTADWSIFNVGGRASGMGIHDTKRQLSLTLRREWHVRERWNDMIVAKWGVMGFSKSHLGG